VKLEAHRNRFGSLQATIGAVHIRDAFNQTASEIVSGAPLRMEMDVSLPDTLTPAMASATLRRSDDLICLDTYTEVARPPEGGRLRLDIERLDLAAGQYVVDVGLYSGDWQTTYDYHFGAYPFTVTGRSGGAGMMAPPTAWRVGVGVVAR
jgi:lipopolysaccharide transport system ATP-binding protein